MRLLAIIPAKAHSNRLPGKNSMLFHGVPLYVRACRVAKEARIFTDIIVSSDSQGILDGARQEGASPLLRHPNLTADGVETAAVVFDVLSKYRYYFEAFCLLLPTSPLRTPTHLRQCWREFLDSGADCLMTWSTSMVGSTHDGTALFCKTLPFLAAMDFWKMQRVDYHMKLDESADINTQEDFDRAVKLWTTVNSSKP